MLSPAQLQAFRTIHRNKDLKYYCFVGGSGTGKTQMSLITVDHLIRRYLESDPSQNIQVYLTYRNQSSEENSALEEDVFQLFSKRKRNGNATFHISTFDNLGRKKNFKNTLLAFNTSNYTIQFLLRILLTKEILLRTCVAI